MSDHQDGPGGPSPPPLVQETVTHMSSRHINGRKNSPSDDVEADSELSEPDSNLHSPPATGLEDEIVVGAKADRPHKTSPLRVVSMDQDHVMEDVRDESSTGSHYPKRKRTSLYNDLSETKMEISQAQPVIDTRSPPLSRDGKSKPNRQSLTGVKGVLLGHWRDSTVPDESRKHAVIGFIDVRDRLRTRVQPQTKEGESLTETYPLPPGPGGSWVTFERVVFSDHLVGLDHFHIKEYTRLRSVVAPEETEEERKVAEVEAVREAVRRVKENPATDNPTAAPAIAYGTDIPEHLATPNRPDGKRRKTPPQPMAAHQTRFSIDPLPGTRPTRILIGYWKPSSEAHPRDRHAVYGILGQNDMFRVKVYQLDHGETDADRIDNETKAVYEAQTRAGSLFKQPNNVTVPTFSAAPTPDAGVDRPASRLGHGGHELRQSRRIEPRPDGRTLRQALTESELRSAQRMQGVEAAERTSALARREIARAEAAQGRADRKALTRERAVAAATDAVTAAAAAAAAAAAPVPSTNGRALFHESEEMQRLNKVWARQESLRLKGGAEDAKMYDGVKYERKPTGPFMGKLVSQGTIINIDGEDYVEYRVLTKPSFF
ncbi:tRNA splicing endonuclease subunit [Hirsutella rhossiliensis]|uniref:tRNA splicing endonuclease subunit n=1 Tax=Hirsutella rhossiliensis TaxID=111463 RepID=A0A9P8SN70_9HYPO|nr:tRNA splicing endonuclease subunit [Hirsutella rhossiliensis]KAH0966876.1 tRNA splicing endonuclease subunit [Hirsutella rhossiliensis]